MENQNMLSKTIGLHRTAVASTLAIFSTMQQHGEDILKKSLEQSPWLPESNKNAYLYCADFYGKYLENLKSAADLGFAEIERISMPGLRPEGKKPQQTKTTARTSPPSPIEKNPSVREKKVSEIKAVVAKTTPDNKPVTQNVPAYKPVVQERPEVKKSPEVPAATSTAKPSVTSQTAAEPASGNKESASHLLKPKG